MERLTDGIRRSRQARRSAGLYCCVVVLLASCSTTAPSVSQAPSVSPSAIRLPTDQPVPQNHSPGLDGSANTIAFSGRIDSPADGDIYTIGVDGSHLRRLTSSPANEYSPSWSPDGLQIVFRSAPSSKASEQGPSDIAVLTLADLRGTFLTHDARLGNWSPAWSPTGEWVAYYSGGPNGPGLYLIRPDGSENHQILAGDAEYPAWSPDGRRLVFMSLGFPAGSSSNDYDIYVVDVDGGNLQRLTKLTGEDGWPSWSNDGTRIGYTRRTNEDADDKIHVMSAAGEDDHAITDISDGFSYSSPSWSPRDLYLAFSAYPQTEGSTAVGGLFVMRPDGSERLMILPDGVGPTWQPAP
jgi:Tol biopolymer transport system component